MQAINSGEPTMTRFWVVAPYHADKPEVWEKVWKYDLENGLISIGWRQLGDVSSLEEEQLLDLVRRTYPHYSPAGAKISCRMLHKFYHSVKPCDVVIARRGTKKLAAIGTVKRAAYHESNKTLDLYGQGQGYASHLDVQWDDAPRDKTFAAPVFGMQTIYEIPEEKFRALNGADIPESQESVKDQTEFVLEKYLEDFIVSNFDAIFKKQLVLFSDPYEGPLGQQFDTEDAGVIDILAQDPKSNAFVVIELKKGRESDKVVGQMLRYMGWVAENLCQLGQEVHGIIVCKEPDDRLLYALKMVKNVSLKYYRVDFKLQDQP
jgi:restriction system protein